MADKAEARAGTDGGLSGELAPVDPFVFRVAPATADEFNTVRLRLIPVACWQVDDIRFAFDSSFVNADPSPDDPADIREELDLLATLVKDHPGAPLSVFGHADPVGTDVYNKALSGRRASAVYALLISNTDPGTAVKMWQQIAATEHWGNDQRQVMQDVTGLPAGTGDAALFQAYMQALCPPELQLAKTDFLGQGSDAHGKGDFQGCGEFNPLILPSKELQAAFDKAKQQNDQAAIEKRNSFNAPNRRVMVLLFRKGSQIDPAKWPCPRASEGVAGCTKRFWSDGEARRSKRLPGQDRKFEETADTFSCRFYQRISSGSPCDQLLRSFKIRLFDSIGNLLPRAPFVVIQGGNQSKVRNADAAGEITLRDIGVGVVTIKWSRPASQRKDPPPPATDIVIGRDGKERQENIPTLPPEQFEFQRDVVVTINNGVVAVATDDGPMTEDAARSRLSNMGYLVGDQFSDLIRAFERDVGLPETGELTDDVVAKLKDFHDVQVKSPGFSSQTADTVDLGG